MDWLHDWPTLLGAGFVVAGLLVPTLIGSAYLQPVVARLLRGEKDPNTPVALLLNAFTLYYGVLLGLLSIAVFGNYDKAQDTIGREAASVVALYRNLNGYPEPTRTALIDVLRRYVDEETGPGWGEQRRDLASTPGVRLVDELSRGLLTFRPDRQAGEDILHQETLRTFGEFVERRRTGIQAGATSIPAILWSAVLIGAVLNVFVLWLFDLSRTTHLVLGGVLTAFIGLVIYMMAMLDEHSAASMGSRRTSCLRRDSRSARAEAAAGPCRIAAWPGAG
jgi:hypothetical protein